ncbi:hypothetical protein BD770DRAFT_334880 [Pilaira anomala]|nr:hypothetical protein BD770DRAFT_334880 [Pilaira anomala]
MILVKIFASQLIKEIGRQFLSKDKSPFFGSSRTRISCQDKGKIPFSASAYSCVIKSLSISTSKSNERYGYPSPSDSGLLLADSLEA